MTLSPLSRPKGAAWRRGTLRIIHGAHSIHRMINQRQIAINNRAKAHAAGYSL